ncbi:MAG: hypothetical protein JXX14_11085 [Deltaproteobacteria bacterium]|nr:hypothetical protein [Deltaproteobacteria bacterium]
MKHLAGYFVMGITLWMLPGCEDIDLLAHVDDLDTESAGDTNDLQGSDSTGVDGDTETVQSDPQPRIDGWQWRICEAMPLTGFENVEPGMNPNPAVTPPMQLAGTDQFVTMYTESELDFLFYTSVNTFPSSQTPTNYNLYSSQGDSVRALPLRNGGMAYVRRSLAWEELGFETKLAISDLQPGGTPIEIPLPGQDLGRLPSLLALDGIVIVFSELNGEFTFGAETTKATTLNTGDAGVSNYMAAYTVQGELIKAQLIDLPFIIGDVELDTVSNTVIAAGMMSHSSGDRSIGVVRLSPASIVIPEVGEIEKVWASYNVLNSDNASFADVWGLDVVPDKTGGFFIFSRTPVPEPVGIFDGISKVGEASGSDIFFQIMTHYTAENQNDWLFFYDDDDKNTTTSWDVTWLRPSGTVYAEGLLFLAGTASKAFLEKMRDAGTPVENNLESFSPVMVALVYGNDGQPPHFNVVRRMPAQLDIQGLSVTDAALEADGMSDVVLSALYKKDIEFPSPVLTPEGETMTLAPTNEEVVLLKVCDIELVIE